MTVSKKHINFSQLQQTFQFQETPIENIIKNIKKYSDEHGNLLEKYNQEFFLTYFDRNTIKQGLGKLGKQQNKKKQLKMHQFVRSFLSMIEHKEDETLFLAMSLRNLFLKIRQQTSNQNGVKFSDFTNYLCERISKQNPDLIAPLKQIAQQKNTPDISRIRQIDINAPIILNNQSMSMPRIAKQKKKKDKKLCEKKPISKFIFNEKTRHIITMGRLSSSIYFYDLDLNKLPIQIVPKTYKDMTRQIAILSLAFSQANGRIGAIINGVGIAFWEASDNYQTQKTISKFKGQRIFYLKLFKQWVTVDKNSIYFWDIKQQIITKTICQEDSKFINDICQINHLRCICVSLTTKDDKKLLVVYKDFKPIVRYDLGSSGCHTLHYNIPTQMIITAGYHNQLQVFELQNKTYSINLKKQLKGHSSIVTCLTDIKNTNFILSGDDSGQVRIWELNFMKCIQVVKISKYINEIVCTGQKLIFSDSRLNTMEMDKFKLSISDDEQIIYNFYDEQRVQQYLVTRKSIRQVNFNTGRIQKIFIVCDQEQQISSSIKISSGILIGTSKGIMKLYTLEGKLRWELTAHQNQITQLKYDRKTRFIFSLGSDNKLMIWPQKTIVCDGVKKVLTFKNKNYNLLTIIPEIRVLILGSNQQSQISVWDYENLKLLSIIKLSSPAFFMEVNQLYRILLISTINDEFHFIKLIWKNGILTFQVIYNGDSSFSGQKKNFKNYQSQQKSKYNLKFNGPQNEESIMIKNKDQKSLKTLSKKNVNKQTENIKSNQPQAQQFFMTSTKISKAKIGKNQDKNTNRSIQFEQKNQNVPSIKLIKQQSNQFVNKQSQKTIGTLKTMKNLHNQLTTRIQIFEKENSTILVVANNKGSIFTYNIDSLIKQQFPDYQIPIKKNQSPHIYRPVKEDFEVQYSKHKHSQKFISNLAKIQKVKKNYFKPFWTHSILTKQSILYLSMIQMKQNYVCASMTDGCCKYFDISNGEIKGNLKIALPLPIIWDITVEKDLYIKKNVYQTLLILDDILTNHGFEMLSKQYKTINISKFLQLLKKQKYQKVTGLSKKKINILPQQLNNKVSLLHEQYSIEDLKHVSSNQNTLKSLQAYKRVKQIKQKMNSQIKQRSTRQQESNDGVVKLSNEILRQKQQIQRWLAPYYFPKLEQNGNSSKINKSIEIGSIEERSIMLLQKINKQNKKLHRQNSMDKKGIFDISKQPLRIKRQASLLPTLPTLRSNYNESSLMQTSKIYDRKQCNKENKQNDLVNKINSSFSNGCKQKGFEVVSIYSSTCPTVSQILKSSVTSSEISGKKQRQLAETKKSLMKLKIKEYGLQQKPTKQILKMINQNLQRHKKASYAKRNLI